VRVTRGESKSAANGKEKKKKGFLANANFLEENPAIGGGGEGVNSRASSNEIASHSGR